MKHLIIITITFLLSLNLTAQSVKIKGEKVLVDKELYCHLEKGGNAMSSWSYTIKNLKEEELIFLKSTTVEISKGVLKAYYTVTISETEETFEVEHFMGFKKDFIRKLYKYSVIKNDKIEEDGLKKYKRMFAGDFKEQYEKEANRAASTVTIINNNNGNNTEDYIIVERDKTSHLFINGGKVKQNFKQIATFKVEEEEVNDEDLDVIYIYNINNQLVAKGYTDNFEKSIKIITMKDNKRHFATSKSSLDSHKIETTMELLIKYLYI